MGFSIDYIETARELICLQQSMQADLPYHINLVDAIGADENANSRILASLLSQHDDKGNYQMLKAFAQHFFYDTNLAELIDTPKIVTEQQVKNDKRIDIYINEPGKYAIILENKVMDAPAFTGATTIHHTSISPMVIMSVALVSLTELWTAKPRRRLS